MIIRLLKEKFQLTAKEAPIPSVTKRAGKAQHINVAKEVNKEIEGKKVRSHID